MSTRLMSSVHMCTWSQECTLIVHLTVFQSSYFLLSNSMNVRATFISFYLSISIYLQYQDYLYL